MLPLKELLPTTGYIRGGCSPIGLKKPFPVYIDQTALQYDKVYISAGQRGLQLYMAPTDIQKAVNASIADVSTDIID